MSCSSGSEGEKGLREGFWSKDKIKEIFLNEQRQYMWNKDYWRNLLVPLFHLLPNSAVLDVGCGLGFIGRNLADFVPEGKTIGVDLDARLIEAARKIAEDSGFKAAFDFRVGSALDLPVESESVDLSICQFLLMHLEEPLKAVAEMQRVTRKGGRVVAIEPDYASVSFFDTAFEKMNYSLEERVKFRRWELMMDFGKRKLRMGDNQIGSKVSYLFHKSGLRVIDIRSADRILWLIPPYQQEGDDLQLKHVAIPPESMAEIAELKPQFLAGGGSQQEWEEYLTMLKKEHEVRQEQIQEKTYVNAQIMAVVITIAETV